MMRPLFKSKTVNFLSFYYAVFSNIKTGKKTHTQKQKTNMCMPLVIRKVLHNRRVVHFCKIFWRIGYCLFFFQINIIRSRSKRIKQSSCLSATISGKVGVLLSPHLELALVCSVVHINFSTGTNQHKY